MNLIFYFFGVGIPPVKLYTQEFILIPFLNLKNFSLKVCFQKYIKFTKHPIIPNNPISITVETLRKLFSFERVVNYNPRRGSTSKTLKERVNLAQ